MSPKTANLGVVCYAPETSFEMAFTMPDAYSLSGKDVVIEFSKKGSDTVYSFGDDTAVTVIGQTVAIEVLPSMESGDKTFAELVEVEFTGRYKKLEFSVDMSEDGVVDYRMQGDLKVQKALGDLDEK